MGCIEPTEKKGSDHHPAASWWLDKNSCDHNRVHHSQWLQPTLAGFSSFFLFFSCDVIIGNAII